MDLSTIEIKDLIDINSLCQENVAVPLDWEPLEPEISKSEAAYYTAEGLDEYLKPKVLIPIAGELKRGSVLKRKCNEHGQSYGSLHIDSILDITEYVIEFNDGESGLYTVNYIYAYVFTV